MSEKYKVTPPRPSRHPEKHNHRDLDDPAHYPVGTDVDCTVKNCTIYFTRGVTLFRKRPTWRRHRREQGGIG